MTYPRGRAPAPVNRTGVNNPPMPADAGVPVGNLPSQYGQGQQAPGNVVITFPWWERPTLSSLDFQPLVQSVILPAGGVVDLAFVDVPESYYAVLRGVSIFGINTTVLFNVDFNVLYQDSPLFQQPLKTFGRVAASMEVPFSFAKRVRGPGRILVRAVDDGAGPFTVGAQLTGWLTPVVDADRAMG